MPGWARSAARSRTPPARSRHSVTAAVSQTAATTAAPTGRVSPASEASTPAHIHRPVSTAYTPQAASAVNSDSEYAIDCTIPTGSAAHRAARAIPARGPCSRSPVAYSAQAAASDVSQATTIPASAGDSGERADSPRSSHGSSGKKARLECTSPLGSWTV